MAEPYPWTQLFRRIKTSIPAAIDDVIRGETFQVMIDFTQDTNIWKETIPISIQPNVYNYPFTVTGGVANRLIIVYDPATQQSSNYPPVWADSFISMRVPGIIALVRTPSAPVTWNVTVAKACFDNFMDTTQVPPVKTLWPNIDSWIVEKNNDAIFFGVMAYLQKQPSKAYTNPKDAEFNMRQYRSMKAEAKANDQMLNTLGGQAWTFPQGWATIRRKGWA
jgi:hypothetical protein